MMKLMYAPASPFARKVRVAAAELGLAKEIELEFTEVQPGRPNLAYAEAYNPLRKIPALALDDGSVVYDSTVIVEYLDERAGGGRLVPKGKDRWRVLTAHALAQGMCDAAILMRYETWLRPEGIRWQTWTDDQAGKIKAGLDWFEAHPRDLEGPINLAQIALGCLLGYLDYRFPQIGWRADRPRLERWFAEIAKRESFTSTPPDAPRPA
jgi:glutathione S-transferase